MTNCLTKLPSTPSDYSVLTALGSELNKIFINTYSHSHYVIMLDVIVDDYEEISGIKDNIYAITELTPYVTVDPKLLYNKYQMKFYEYYSTIIGELFSKLFSYSLNINSDSFYSMLNHISESSIQFSKQHFISDSLYYVKLLDNGKYEKVEWEYYNIFQQPFDYFYFSNDTYLYCNWENSDNLGYAEIKYIIIINPQSNGLKYFLDVVIDRLSFIHQLPYKYRVIAIDIDISNEDSFTKSISEIVTTFHPLFLGGKTAKERKMINKVITERIVLEEEVGEEEDVFLFHIYPFNTEECYTRVYHLSSHIYGKIYDSIYYFINKGGKNFYVIEDEVDDEEKEYMEKQFHRMNEIYKYIGISFNVIYVKKDTIIDDIKVIKPDNNDIVYIYLDKLNVSDILDEFQSKGINSTNCDIILLNYFSPNVYNETEYNSYYYTQSIFSIIKDFHYYDSNFLRLDRKSVV